MALTTPSCATSHRLTHSIPYLRIINMLSRRSCTVSYTQTAVTQHAQRFRPDSPFAWISWEPWPPLTKIQMRPCTALLRKVCPRKSSPPFRPACSGLASRRTCPDAPGDIHLLHCSGNWTKAEENPETQSSKAHAATHSYRQAECSPGRRQGSPSRSGQRCLQRKCPLQDPRTGRAAIFSRCAPQFPAH